VSTSLDNDTDSTELDGNHDSQHDPGVDMHMEDDVEKLEGVELDGDVDMEWDVDDDEEEDEEEKDEEKEDEEEDKNEGKDEYEEEDQDEDDGKEPWTIGQ